MTRSSQAPLKSAAASADTVTLEFPCELQSLCLHSPGAVRIQETVSGSSRRSRSMRRRDGTFVSPSVPRPCRSCSMAAHRES